MALIACPECEKTISDQAVARPNCGYPVRGRQQQQPAAPKTPKPKSAPKRDVPVALQCKFLHGDFWSWSGQTGIKCRCPICGGNVSGTLNEAGKQVICPLCGGDFRVPAAAEVKSGNPSATGARRAERPYDGCAITGFVLGLGAIFLWGFWLVVPILAVIFSAIGLGRTGGAKRRGKGLAITGLILGLVYLVVAFLAWAERNGEWPY